MAKKRGKYKIRGREFWKKTVKEFHKSGASQSEFARQKGLQQSTLGRWVRLFGHGEKKQDLVRTELIEIVAPPSSPPHIETGPARLIVGAATLEFSTLPSVPYISSLLREVASC